MPVAHQLGLSLYRVLLDYGKFLLSYGIIINSFHPDVHHMTPQILSISIDFTQTSVPFFGRFSNI